ncbi:hypothetical protein ABPG74_022181 [Tetrahymena malaccensis]
MHSQRFIGMYSQLDIKLIILQIVTMQFLFYLSQLVLLFIFNSVFGKPTHIGQIFDFSIYASSPAAPQLAYISYLTNLFNIPIVIVGLSNIIVKANKVLDFVSTIYGYHFLICFFYNGSFFESFEIKWLIINGLILLVTVLAGEYVCIKLEQLEIKFLDNLFVALGPSKETPRKIKQSNMSGHNHKFIEMKDVVEV